MTLGPQELVRSEVEGGLSGPANSLTSKSIDCGCGRYQLSRLAKFATRRIFLVLLCSIGILQATAQAYFRVTSHTIARIFNFDLYLMEWIVCSSETVLIFAGLIISYWGDRLHRTSWLGGITLIQCASFLFLVIPRLSNQTNIIDSSENITKASIFSEIKSELCMEQISLKAFTINNSYGLMLFILILVQIITGIASIAFYALGFSYLDDNTKKLHVPIYFSVVLATRIIGSVFGYTLGWGYLRIDVDTLKPITSYENHFGAWWLGWPIIAILLAIPSMIMAIFPRKLPSEMVEQIAEMILDQSGTLRGSQKINTIKVGSTEFLPSMFRLLKNKILICNILAAAFFMTALANFIAKENIYLESRFYVPRPTGIFLGFNDPLLSRVVITILNPMLIGLAIMVNGLVIARIKPSARTLINYSVIVLIASTLIISGLAFNTCEKAPIVGLNKDSSSLIKYCNRNCQCSRNAEFQPVCDNGLSLAFYSPCHAGCTSVKYDNNHKIYSNCSCIEENKGLGNIEASPCTSGSCQIGWLIFEIFTSLVYTAAASTIIGDLLISLRSVNVQDKALAMGYSMMLISFFVTVPGKILYDKLEKATCIHWGANDNLCHLHHSTNLGNYLCFLTAGLIAVSALLKIGLWFLCKNIKMYDPSEIEVQPPRELMDMSKTQAEPLLQPKSGSPIQEINENPVTAEIIIEPIITIESTQISSIYSVMDNIRDAENLPESRLKYGPLGPGNRRVENQSNLTVANTNTDDELDSSDSSQIQRTSSVSQISYKPLEIDSDVESDLSGTAPRCRKRLQSIDLDERKKVELDVRPSIISRSFPNPDNYEDPRNIRSSKSKNQNVTDGPFTRNNFECFNKVNTDTPLSASRGDFNEIGIPLVESYKATIKGSTSSLRTPTIMMAIQHLDKNPSHQTLDEARFAYKSTKEDISEEIEENRKFRLEKLMQPIQYISSPTRSPSRDQGSSGFGSLQDMRDRTRLQDVSDSRDSLSTKSSASGAPKKGSPLCTDL